MGKNKKKNEEKMSIFEFFETLIKLICTVVLLAIILLISTIIVAVLLGLLDLGFSELFRLILR